MRSIFTSSADRRPFIPFTSRLPQRVAAQAYGAGAERLVHVSGIGSPMLPHDRGTSESAAKANWGSGPFVFLLSMFFSENRCPLFRIML
jgi:hypothetical protein